MFSILSLLEVLLGKDPLHINVLAILWNVLPKELQGIISATKIVEKIKEPLLT